MLAGRGYATKKALKAAVGKPFHYTETSLFGEEFRPSATHAIVGPSAYERTWYAQVTVDADGVITGVK